MSVVIAISTKIPATCSVVPHLNRSPPCWAQQYTTVAATACTGRTKIEPHWNNSQQSCKGDESTDPAWAKYMFTGAQWECRALWTVITTATFTGEIISGIICNSKHDSGLQKAGKPAASDSRLVTSNSSVTHWILSVILHLQTHFIYLLWIRKPFFCGHYNPIRL